MGVRDSCVYNKKDWHAMLSCGQLFAYSGLLRAFGHMQFDAGLRFEAFHANVACEASDSGCIAGVFACIEFDVLRAVGEIAKRTITIGAFVRLDAQVSICVRSVLILLE